MQIAIEPGVRLFVDIEGPGLVPDGPSMREKPTLILYNPTPGSEDARARTRYVEEILFASAGGEQQTMQLLPGLAEVQCPVLVMAGELDPVTPLADAQDIAAAIPAPWGRLVSFPQAGHGAWRDQPDQAMAVLRDFIAQGLPSLV